MSLANRLEGLSKEAVFNCFVSGLNADIKLNVVAFSPPNLVRVVALAGIYEEKYMPNQTSVGISPTKHKHSPCDGSFVTATTKISPRNPLSNTKTTLPPLLPTPPSRINNEKF